MKILLPLLLAAVVPSATAKSTFRLSAPKRKPSLSFSIQDTGSSTGHSAIKFVDDVELTTGSTVVLNGYWPGNGKFSVEFIVDQEITAAIFEIRPNEKVVIVNAKNGVRYDEYEERRENPLLNQSSFELEVRFLQDSILFIVNSEWRKAFDYRVAPSKITRLEVRGDVIIKKVSQFEEEEYENENDDRIE